ncbi:MAG: hypothetical protein DWH79_03475 [Planctomycetota bacterium]|nr:MAG: hypothetical protein DWH79_03475 [Planctomycetota bacterium]
MTDQPLPAGSTLTLWGVVREFVGGLLPTSNGQRRALAGLLATAVDEQIPLPPLLFAWATDERGLQAARVRKLATLLERGTPLESALPQVPGALRPRDATALRLAAGLGCGAERALVALDDPSSAAAAVEENLRGTIVYTGTLVALFVPVALLIALKIVPQFKKIFDDFGMEMPVWFRLTNTLSAMVATLWPIVVLGFLFLGALVFSPRLRTWVCRRCGLGVLGVLNDARSAEVFGALGAEPAGSRPELVLAALSGASDDARLAARLGGAEGGSTVGRTLAATGLATPSEADLIDAASGSRGAWVATALARRRRARVLERTWLVSELLLPVIVLVMGAFVLTEALGILTPISKLIMGLS